MKSLNRKFKFFFNYYKLPVLLFLSVFVLWLSSGLDEKILFIADGLTAFLSPFSFFHNLNIF